MTCRAYSMIPSIGTLILALFRISVDGFHSLIILILTIFGFCLFLAWFAYIIWYSWIVWCYANYLRQNKKFFDANPNYSSQQPSKTAIAVESAAGDMEH